MQINELKLPENSKKMSFELSSNGVISKLKPEQPSSRSQPFGSLDSCIIELGQLNSIKLTRNSRYQELLHNNPFVTIHTPQPAPQRKLKCHCKKSKCLKFYCECFSNQLFCGKDCECENCSNSAVNSKQLQSLRGEISGKRSFQGKGCKCTKSGCQKKYCDCFNKGLVCGQDCTCENCENGGPSANS